jgi:hypothetical protein
MKTFLLQLLAALLLFFAPIQELVMAVGLAIMLDTFTGIYKSVKLQGWKSIRSRKLSNIISKMVLYEVSIIILYPIDKFLLNELFLNILSVQFFSTKIACVLLILVELTSIKENIESALKINIWQILKKAINRAKEISHDVDDIANPK